MKPNLELNVATVVLSYSLVRSAVPPMNIFITEELMRQTGQLNSTFIHTS